MQELVSLADLPRKLSRREYRAKYGEAAMPDPEAEFARFEEVMSRRDSDRLPGVAPQFMPVLDAMLDAHGLRAVLVTLRQLADSRANTDDWEVNLSEIGAGEAWKAAADNLEILVLSRAVNVK